MGGRWGDEEKMGGEGEEVGDEEKVEGRRKRWRGGRGE